jgi:hypothetical protein
MESAHHKAFYYIKLQWDKFMLSIQTYDCIDLSGWRHYVLYTTVNDTNMDLYHITAVQNLEA